MVDTLAYKKPFGMAPGVALVPALAGAVPNDSIEAKVVLY